MRLSGSLMTRIAVLVVVVVFFQIGVVSELPVLGVVVDLSPLLVAFVGLLCGSGWEPRRVSLSGCSSI